jgi:hypothetical protein
LFKPFGSKLVALIDEKQISLMVIYNVSLLNILSEQCFGEVDDSPCEVYDILCHVDGHILPELSHLLVDLLRSCGNLRDSMVDDRVIISDKLQFSFVINIVQYSFAIPH